MAGIDIVRIAYKGTGPALTAIAAGETQIMFAAAGSLEPHVRSGRVKALAVTSAAPSALALGPLGPLGDRPVSGSTLARA